MLAGLSAGIYFLASRYWDPIPAEIRAISKDELNKSLMASIRNNDIAQVKYLIRAGADVNAKDGRSGYSALMTAAEKGVPDLVKILVDAGANVNDRDDEMCTPFMYALKSHNPEIVSILVKAGADVNEPSINNLTPLMVAVMFDKIKIIPVLINSGADINAKVYVNGRGAVTALDIADADNNYSAASILRQYGAR